VVVECRRLAGLGIDIEPLAPVPPRRAAAILAPGEVSEGFEHGLLRAFAAKEAVF
jgi:4'-phosphopantetheinyl transferase EntD